jgi:tetratricopeptide (TPR) repeat protein
VLAAVLAAGGLFGQDALERAKTALEQRDQAGAEAALGEILGAEGPSRNDLVQQGLVAFRDAGATDAWLRVASGFYASHPDDAAIAFYLGTTLQDLKHLRRAEEALSRAHALAPSNPAVTESWAWNAKLRFDSAGVAERTRGATFQGADRMRAEEEARLAADRTGSLALFGVIGLGLVGATVFVLGRLARM